MILQGITFVTWQNTQPIVQQVKVKLMGVLSLLRKERKDKILCLDYLKNNLGNQEHTV